MSENVVEPEAGGEVDFELDEIVVTAKREQGYFGLGTNGSWSTDDSVKNDPNISVGMDGIGIGGPLAGVDMGPAGTLVLTGDTGLDVFDQSVRLDLDFVYAPPEQIGPFRSLSVEFNNEAKLDGDIDSIIKANIEFDAPDALFGEDSSLNVSYNSEDGHSMTGGIGISISKSF